MTLAAADVDRLVRAAAPVHSGAGSVTTQAGVGHLLSRHLGEGRDIIRIGGLGAHRSGAVTGFTLDALFCL